MDENLSLLPTFQHDYIGMAQDLRRMRKEARQILINCNYGSESFPFPKEWNKFMDNLFEFEDYCLNQPCNVYVEYEWRLNQQCKQ